MSNQSGFWVGLLFAGAAAYLLNHAARTTCPLCQSQVAHGIRTCPHCGVGLSWPS